ncbi:putative glucan 4-alpha-glucosidase-like protein [Phaeoacremonium minimum UCRPA7]|uniref:Putative glucan 4-alpha-glucosidase-like protein n=1 Tax=Phaeoacremonium minimum (strain UCR-PA7) TaxID=1286976 RepID=R8BME2_PHAM7|nr:putative glucan 4-alpha-glucosidase-like protein [Phaeoacremonium minimum UCRPA7]EOO00430.1 putative glucan 4-alpha-glucosidase-like protein [Phaeoacremonium minimum UCRPA7]
MSAEKAARRVGYNSPLTQTIITNKYTKSHIDLLVEEVSPYTTPVTDEQAGKVLDLTMAYTGDETRDGGQTPGPFEEMRRRMAGLATSTPVSPSGGIRKRKKKDKDKKRRWVWTIGQEEDDEDIGGALAAIRAAARASASNTPVEGAPATSVAAPLQPTVVVDSPMEILTPSIETAGQDEEVADEVMSQTGSTVSESVDRALTPGDMDIDMITPTVTRKRLLSADIANRQLYRSERQDSVDLFNPDTGSRRDTPVPADMMVA